MSERREGHSKLVVRDGEIVAVNQADANFMAGIEVGVRCSEKGMNLQAALEFGRGVIREYPVNPRTGGRLSHERE